MDTTPTPQTTITTTDTKPQAPSGAFLVSTLLVLSYTHKCCIVRKNTINERLPEIWTNYH